jgi:uncharacterized protein (TIGR00725 family)
VKPERPLRIAVCGSGEPNEITDALADEVGRLIARNRAVLLCGGLKGTMEAAARGCVEAGGITVGVLPGQDASAANDYITLPLATGMGEARNAILVRSADVVIAIGGEWGTLSEIALARKIGRPVILLESTIAANLNLPTATSAKEAVHLALEAARQ